MRKDGRPVDALRAISIDRHFIKSAPGSVMIAFGETKVLCTVMFEEQPPAWLRNSGQGWLTAEYNMLPASSPERVTRDAARKGRSLEIGRLIGRALRAVVDLKAIGECQIIVDCDVIQADGGTRTAAVTGAFIALHDGLSKAVTDGRIGALPIRSCCAAVSVGIVDGTPMLDLCYEEDARASVDMNLVMDGEGRFIEIQATGEQAVFSRDEALEMIRLGEQGIRELVAMQKGILNIA